MKTSRTQESPSRIRLSIEATSEEVSTAVDRAFEELGREVRIPGFRPGRAPRRILEARLPPETVREAALREALPMLIARAVQEENIAPIAPPAVEVAGFEVGGPLEFHATFDVRPDIRLPELSSLTVDRPSVDATDEEIDEQLERLRDRFSTLETVARPAARGDYALVDVRSTIHDTTVEEATASDLLYALGSDSFVPELDRELDGTRAGDILRFNATLPATLRGEHAGAEATMQILVKEVREKVLPALDDEFARSASEFDTLEELREDLRARVGLAKAAESALEVRSRLLEQLVEGSDVDPPRSLVQEEMAFRAQRFAERLRGAGLTFEAYLERSGQGSEAVEADLRQQAERNVAAQLILEEIGRRENLSATEEELAEELRRHAEELGQDPEDLRKELERAGRLEALSGDIIRRKALEIVVDRAEVRTEAS